MIESQLLFKNLDFKSIKIEKYKISLRLKRKKPILSEIKL